MLKRIFYAALLLVSIAPLATSALNPAQPAIRTMAAIAEKIPDVGYLASQSKAPESLAISYALAVIAGWIFGIYACLANGNIDAAKIEFNKTGAIGKTIYLVAFMAILSIPMHSNGQIGNGKISSPFFRAVTENVVALTAWIAAVYIITAAAIVASWIVIKCWTDK